MPWQSDRNIGACTLRTCREMACARCDAFFCQSCCETNHAEWSAHRQPSGVITPVRTGFRGDPRLPGHYAATVTRHSDTCVCVNCKPITWDYDKPPEFGETKELGADYDRCFIPLSNFKSNKEWPVDYVG